MVALKLDKYGGLGYKAACAPVYNYASSGKSLHKNHRPQSTNMPSCSVGKLYAHPRISSWWGITVRDITLTLWSTQNILTQSYTSWSSNHYTEVLVQQHNLFYIGMNSHFYLHLPCAFDEKCFCNHGKASKKWH